MSVKDSPADDNAAVTDTYDKEHAQSVENQKYRDESRVAGPPCQEQVRNPSDKTRTGLFCEQCAEQRKSRTVIAQVYCHDCYQFQCDDCHHGNHGNSGKMKGRVIKEGHLMPKSLADKPSRHLKFCGDHPDQLKDKFCHSHRVLICPKCFDQQHFTCIDVVKL